MQDKKQKTKKRRGYKSEFGSDDDAYGAFSGVEDFTKGDATFFQKEENEVMIDDRIHELAITKHVEEKKKLEKDFKAIWF
jgi:hypothetical protein